MSTFPLHASPRRRQNATVFALLAVGALIRLFGCWALRHNLNLDAGVVTLMARHVAQGRALPAFFYGQPHMGAFEPWLSGLACRVFGISGFAVCLGTAVVAWAILPVVYAWTRAIGGHRAGCLAVVFLLIGPGGFFHYSVSPRGAYAAILLFGTAILWRSARMAVRWKTRRRLRTGDELGLGLLVGLAFWSGLLTLPAMLTGGLILLLAMGSALFAPRRLWVVAAGFLAGSAPFWIYNFRHDWASFAMTSTLGRVPMRSALGWFFMDRFPALMFRPEWPYGIRGAVAFFYLALLGTLLWQFWKTRSRGQGSVGFPLGAVLLYVPLLAFIFSLSHFAAINTPRYLLPLVPVVAVGFGAGVAYWTRRMPPWVTLVPIVFVLAMQVPVLSWAARFERRERATRNHVEILGEALRARNIRTLYAGMVHRSWTFTLDEDIVFSDGIRNFYPPHAWQAENDARIAVLNDYGGVRRFLETAGGSAEVLETVGGVVHHAFRPPGTGWRPVDPARLRAIRDDAGRDHAPYLTDGRIDTLWRPAGTPDETRLELELDAPLRLSGMRLSAPTLRDYPREWGLWGWTAQRGWFELVPTGPNPVYFWSGSRPYPGEPFYRLEIRFAPATLEKMRFVRPADPDMTPWRLDGLQLMRPDDAAAGGPPPGDGDLLEQLDAHAVTRLYADRAESLRVHAASGGRIWTPPAYGAPGRTGGSAHEVILETGTGFLTLAAEAAPTRETLSARGLNARETAVGPWILFDAPPGAPWTPEHSGAPGLFWAGFGLLTDQACWANAAVASARRRFEVEPDPPALDDTLYQALRAHPFLHEARRMLATLHRNRGEIEPAREQERLLEAATAPLLSAPIRYRSAGLAFLGYRFEPAWARPGQALGIRYYWRVDREMPFESLAVFVHFRRDGIRFQDDHVLFEDVAPALLRGPPEGPVFVDRLVTLPADLEPGSLDIHMGVYDRRSGRRLRPGTALDTRRRAVMLPAAIMVREAESNQDHAR